ncbi:SCO family protein [Ideonella livida]|uniref:SCO family protein n=1 Tax=Ideonella livida TaxID=2707176 RepID=A0A7C9TLF5_9BURK|nr:SCO family protein [Ideonella livida]NDY92562.1 SCO family protein [Ideonella livida]
MNPSHAPLATDAADTAPPNRAGRRLLLAGTLLGAAGAALLVRSWPAAPRPAAPDAGSGAPAAPALRWREPAGPVPAFRATGPQGRVDRQSLLGRWSLVFFGYTQCPDICPGTLGMLTEVFRLLPAELPRPGVLFLSVDPERDLPGLLAEYLPAFHPDFRGAAGTDADLAALVAHLGVRYHRHAPGPQGQYTVDHTASMFLLDPQARWRAELEPPHEPQAIARALTPLLAAVSAAAQGRS